MAEDVKKLIEEIRGTVTSKSSSQKDEIRVMKAMLNDRDYSVDVYGKDGKEGELNPSAEAREMISSVLTNTAKINKEEAKDLADKHEFNKNEAENFVNVSKEYVNTYLGTKRKLPLGGRKLHTASLVMNEYEQQEKQYPHQIGVGADNKPIWQSPRPTKIVPPYNTIKATSPVPDWIKKNEIKKNEK